MSGTRSGYAERTMLGFLIALAIWSLFVGAFARLALPGRDPMSIPATIGLGFAGTFIAGLVVYAVSGGRAAPGFLGALLFAVGILYFIRRRNGGGLTRPGRDARV